MAGEREEDLPSDTSRRRRAVVAVGSFDGVHLGHQCVCDRLVKRAAEVGMPSLVAIFRPAPEEIAHPDCRQPLLTGYRRRAELIAERGVASVIELPYTVELAGREPAEFVRRVLREELAASILVTGDDVADADTFPGRREVAARCAAHGITVERVPLARDGAEPISTAGIRARLAAGDVETAERRLGRPHRVTGVVVRGHRRGGSALGFPTANVEPGARSAIPRDGVYAGRLGEGERRWPAAVSVGVNTTFDDAEPTVEAYALDRDDLDLYGCHAFVEFHVRRRDMVRFGSAAELVAQMHRDVDRTRALVTG